VTSEESTLGLVEQVRGSFEAARRGDLEAAVLENRLVSHDWIDLEVNRDRAPADVAPAE
jgi:hypothetical protein